MTTNLELLKTQFKELLDKAEDKDMVSTLTSISDTIDLVSKDTEKLQIDNRELLDSYKQMVKHTAFRLEPNETVDNGPSQPLTFESFIANYKK